VAQVRELRGRYLEEVNERGLLPEAWGGGKYNVSRLIEGDTRVKPEEVGRWGQGEACPQRRLPKAAVSLIGWLDRIIGTTLATDRAPVRAVVEQ